MITISSCAYYEMKEQVDKSFFEKKILLEKSIPKEKTEETTEKNLFYEEMAKKLQVSKNLSLPESFYYDFNSETARNLFSSIESGKISEILTKKYWLDLLFCLAYKKNPEIENLRKRFLAIQERYSQASFLYDLVDRYSSFTNTIKLSSGMQSSKIAAQSPYPRTFALMGETIAIEIKIAHLQYVIGLRDVLFQITSDYLDLWFVKNAIAIENEQLEIISALETTVSEKFKAGLSLYEEVLKVQTMKFQVKLDLENYQLRYKTLETKLLSMADRKSVV